jgi:adenylate kinase family enzyme
MTPKTYLLFGIVGSGKGTQADLLKEYLETTTGKQVLYVSPGNEFRNLLSQDTYTSRLMKNVLQSGKLMPFSIVTWTIVNNLVPHMTADTHIILDGYPRSVVQVAAFKSIAEFYNRTEVEIINIELTKEEATKRMMLRGRSDDVKDAIDQRFWEYENNVIPAFEVLSKEPGCKVHAINGAQSIEAVFADIKKALTI